MTIAFDIRTAPFSRWSVPNAHDEPAHSYYARLVAQEGHNSVAVYSDGIDVEVSAINPERLLNVLLKLPLADERRQLLIRSTAIRDDFGYVLAGQRFNYSDLSFSTRRWCPGCLNESPHHRAWWDIKGITECPYHHHPLKDLDERGKPIRWWWPFLTVSIQGVPLGRPMLRHDDDCAFARYLIGRMGFDTAFNAPLLDQHDLGAVIEICELVGRLVSTPWSEQVPELTPAMAERGFQVLRHDGAALVEAVRTWLRENVDSETRARGYGYVFDWFIRRRALLAGNAFGGLFEKVFRKALALEGRPGNGPLTSNAFMDAEISLTALAQRMQVRPNALAAVANALGYLPNQAVFKGQVKFDPSEAEALQYHWTEMVSRGIVSQMLGLTKLQVKTFAAAGCLREFSSKTTEGERGFRYLRSEVDAVMARLDEMSVATEDGTPVDFSIYAKTNSVDPAQVAISVMKGELGICQGASMSGFQTVSILAEPAKGTRRPLRVLQRSERTMSVAQAEVELNVTRATMLRLIAEGHILEGVGDGSAKWLDRASVMAFAAEYRNANEFTEALGFHLKQIEKRMRASGIDPLLRKLPKAVAPSVATIYRYDDIATVFGLQNDPTVIDDPEFQEFWRRLRGVAGDLPPYLQFPSRLPANGQVIANPKNSIAFYVRFQPRDRILSFEGRRNAAHLGTVLLDTHDADGAYRALGSVLTSLIEKTRRR